MGTVSLGLSLTPHGRLVWTHYADAPPLDSVLADRLQHAFERGSGHGLLLLGADEAGTALPPVQNSDYANRLPRGRTYVRNGPVVDLQITPGKIQAYVSELELYEVELNVAPVEKARRKSICNDCAGAIDSLVELLQGKLSKGVMERICRQKQGLFPSPAEIQLSCSCLDWAGMCKHVAAVLYGIGTRFDHQPKLLFHLRGVDEMELIANEGKAASLAKQAPAAGKRLEGEDLSAMFGLDMAQGATPGVDKPAMPKRAKIAKAPTQGKPKPKRKAATA